MNFVNICDDLGQVISLLKNAVTLLQFFIPILLILFGMLDLGKAVMAGKEDEMKAAQKILIRRVIYALLVFLVVTIVKFAVGLVSQNQGWSECWGDIGQGQGEEIEN